MTENFDLPNLAGHGLSVVAILGSLLGWFPALAALAAFIWYCIQIYASTPVQTYLHNRRQRRLLAIKREMARLEAAEERHLKPHQHHKI